MLWQVGYSRSVSLKSMFVFIEQGFDKIIDFFENYLLLLIVVQTHQFRSFTLNKKLSLNFFNTEKNETTLHQTLHVRISNMSFNESIAVFLCLQSMITSDHHISASTAIHNLINWGGYKN